MNILTRKEVERHVAESKQVVQPSAFDVRAFATIEQAVALLERLLKVYRSGLADTPLATEAQDFLEDYNR